MRIVLLGFFNSIMVPHYSTYLSAEALINYDVFTSTLTVRCCESFINKKETYLFIKLNDGLQFDSKYCRRQTGTRNINVNNIFL